MTRTKIIAGFFLLAILIGLPITIFLASNRNLNESRISANLSNSIEDLTNKVISNTSTDVEIMSASVSRKEKMLEIARKKPDEFLLNVIPDEIRNTLPSSAKDNVEKKVEITGALIESIREENSEGDLNGNSVTIQTVDSEGNANTSYELILRENQEDLSGFVKVTGYLIDELLIPISLENSNSQTNSGSTQIASLDSNVLGVSDPKKVRIAVVMVNFKTDLSDTRNQFTKEILNNIYFSGPESVTTYLDNTSLGTIDATGNINDIYGWITLKNYKRNQVCDIYERKTSNKGFIKAINTQVKTQAAARGKNFSNYDVVGYVFAPSLRNESKNTDGTNCYWNAISKGIPGDSVVSSVHFLNGDYDGVNDVNHGNLDSSSSIKFYSGILAHETGHNLGLSHANGIVCGNKQIAKFDECYIYNYGDRFDLIGGAWDYKSHTNARNKNLLGWLPDSNIKTVKQTTTLNLYSSSVKKNGQTQLVKIPRSTGGNYYLEYKTKENGDNRGPSTLYDGALLRLSDINLPNMKNERGGYQDEWRVKQSYLIDVDKTDNSGRGGLLNPTFKNNMVFTDNSNKINIRQLSHNNEFARMEINILPPTCELEKPEITIPELVKSGNPAARVKYLITVKNKNSSSCPNDGFNLKTVVPSGWNSQISESNITLRSNESKNIELFITSKSSSTDTSNPNKIKFTMSNSDRATFNMTKEVRYLVVGGITPTTSPTTSISPSPTTPISPTASPEPTEAITPAHTVPIEANSTYLNIKLGLRGIGETGNKNPKKRSMELRIKINKAGNQTEEELKVSIPYSPDGIYTDNIKLKNNFPPGAYNIFLGTPGYLSQRIDMSIEDNKVNNLSKLTFSPGDINEDGVRNILDWDIIRYCSDFDKVKNRDICKENSNLMTNSDINSNGKIDIDDINLWLREFTASN